MSSGQTEVETQSKTEAQARFEIDLETDIEAENYPFSPESPRYTPVADVVEPIIYKVEYFGQESGSVLIDSKKAEVDYSKEPPVLEYVEVRTSSLATVSDTVKDVAKTENARGHAYINILSPCVAEALRCVVDYFPSVDFSETIIKLYEPYSVFVFFEKELTEYRQRLEKASEDEQFSCANRWASRHLDIAQSFVRERLQESIAAERARHARGFATFDMLWLLYKPGSDIYYDRKEVGEHDPFIFSELDFDLTNGSTNTYSLKVWNMDADSIRVGATQWEFTISRFAGEKHIPSLIAFPREYLRFAEGVTESGLAAIEEHFLDRGKKWFKLRRKVLPHHFDGYTTTFPRRTYTSIAMVDPDQYARTSSIGERRILLDTVAHPASPLKICSCDRCEESIYRHAVKPKFTGYSHINPLVVESLTDHQYFLCDAMVEAFVFKVRSWQFLHINGFHEPSFDATLLDRLVMKDSTKKFIQDLTQMYIGESNETKEHEQLYTRITELQTPRPKKKVGTTWSVDFVKDKGEGLTMLLHGRPGVGKTYTAECIAEHVRRPLLSLTCTDIGVVPEDIEQKLLKWFKLAENWGAIILIDEADIYMEQRQVSDIERNHLVAGFLRALEYYKGILFLTTNRVGTFDEAFMSRIHVQIYYPEFDDEDRSRLWNTFFQKLEDDRETTMRITQAAKDYVESKELRDLQWNGREIRNAFQVAVALAEAKGKKDDKDRILVTADQIKTTVQMSREFKDYLTKVHRMDPSKKALIDRTRFDAFGKEPSQSDKI